MDDSGECGEFVRGDGEIPPYLTLDESVVLCEQHPARLDICIGDSGKLDLF
jgi:hypothetical protein